MKPIKFDEANMELQPPPGLTEDECNSLWVYISPGGQCISCWKIPFLQRLKLLFHGRVWLSVIGGQTQPPVWLMCKKNLFIYPKKRKQIRKSGKEVRCKNCRFHYTIDEPSHHGEFVSHHACNAVEPEPAGGFPKEAFYVSCERRNENHDCLDYKRKARKFWPRLKFWNRRKVGG